MQLAKDLVAVTIDSFHLDCRLAEYMWGAEEEKARLPPKKSII